jgi:S-formylglutathione hydrolase FrmB
VAARATLVALAVALLVGACGSPAPAEQARVLSRHQVDGRTWDLRVDSPAVGGPVDVRLLLPTRYDAAPEQRGPVFYLLHGCCDSYVSWTRSTDVEELTRESDVLVVMPDGGRVGFYSDWRSGPAWETFHTVELPRLLAAEYRAADRQAIAGVSMGGLGALGYAARHPGRYRAAASFSGIVHTRLSDSVSRNYLGLIESEGEDPQALWGDPATDEETWRQHNPFDLVPKLAGVALFISAGDGTPGPLDPAGTAVDEIESSIGAQNVAFADRLREAGVDARIDLYGSGTHNWPYWTRELHDAWPLIADALDLPERTGTG